MSKLASALEDCAVKSDVFTRRLQRHPARAHVGCGGNGKAGAKMLMMARKGIVRFRRIERAQLLKRAPITDIEKEESPYFRRKLRAVLCFQENSTPHAVYPCRDFGLVLRDPVRGGARVGISSDYETVPTVEKVKALKGRIEKRLSRFSNVSLVRGEGNFRDMKPQVAIFALQLSRDLGALVSAIVQQKQDFIELRREQAAFQIALRTKRPN